MIAKRRKNKQLQKISCVNRILLVHCRKKKKKVLYSSCQRVWYTKNIENIPNTDYTKHREYTVANEHSTFKKKQVKQSSNLICYSFHEFFVRIFDL